MSDLIERAEIISGMLKMGEPIKWGSDSTIIDELLAANAKMRKCLEAIESIMNEAGKARTTNLR